jgi:hypothetical protein
MGKGAYIRIKNKSTHNVAVAIENVEEVESKGMENLQGDLAVGAQLPVDGEEKFNGKYQYIEGEKKMFFQKDGSFNIVVTVDGSSGDSVKLNCNASDWWFEASTENEDNAVKIATDVEEEDDIVRIEVSIYDGFHAKSWMSDLTASIENKPLCRVGLPGTHDSGTYQWDEEAGASPDSDLTMTIQRNLEGEGDVSDRGEGGFFSKIGSAINDKILGQVFDKICRCQDKSIKEQLEAGIRYLDIRVAFHEKSEKFYTCHGVHCVDMKNVIDEIHSFTTENPKEIVLVDVNHLYNMNEKHKALLDDMLATLGDKVADYNQLKPQSTVGEYWAANAQVVLIYHEPKTCEDYGGKVWAPSLIRAPWPQANDTIQLHDKLKANVAQRDKNCFFVLQGILTPDGELIKQEVMESNVSTSLESIAKRVSCKVVDWVEDEWSNDVHNVVIVDFFENCSMVPAIISWNRK